jgi:O-antigen/teichoic acid export membrane protein
VRRRQDRVAVAVIWLFVLVGAFLVGMKSNDPGGVGQLAAGVGFVLTSLYFFVRRARSWRDLIRPPGDAPVGSATAAWLRTIVGLVGRRKRDLDPPSGA